MYLIPFLLLFIDNVFACLPSADVDETTTPVSVTATSIISTTDISTTDVTTDISTTDLSTTDLSTTDTVTTATMASTTITVADPCGAQCPNIYSPTCFGPTGTMCLDATAAMVVITYDSLTLTCTLTLNCPGGMYTYVHNPMAAMPTVKPALSMVTCTTSPPNGWIDPFTMESIDSIVCNDFFV